uniref:Uncharacterized protein n=1 Tax=Zooxanthella nutricula TaxID=1333877 RepID=A0A6U6MSF1_9DINO|mmetsp:Transcript_42240/g.127628  ORF Transcript_42240/g.127628 Transcript_42240/m.127628 type:complete len:429 (+) Transcript_42240:67-1353(+)
MLNGPAVLFIFAAWLHSIVRGSGSVTNYQAFVREYGVDRADDPLSYEQRERLFQERLRMIDAHNAKPNRLWTAGLNHFADYTKEEFEAMLGHRPSYRGRSERPPLSFLQTRPVSKTIASSMDWRPSISSKVKDQGACGSCWAAASVSAIESRLMIQESKAKSSSLAESGEKVSDVDLSVEQLVDCVKNPNGCGGKGGCEGATSELAFERLLNPRHGLMPASAYKNGYKSGRDWSKTCQEVAGAAKGASLVQSEQAVKLVKADMSVSIGSFLRLKENSARAMEEALQDGPLVASVAAATINPYKKGIFDTCPKNGVVNHAVEMTGYGSENNVNYWTFRNSWGPMWGESGYMRILKGGSGSAASGAASLAEDVTGSDDAEPCGWDNNPQEGVYCNMASEPKSIKVCGMCGILSDSAVPMGIRRHDHTLAA